MAFTQTELDALKKAFAAGALTVEYDGKRITYGSADDLWKRIQKIEAEVASTAGTPKPRAGYAGFGRGER
jgi:hypothetical protein